MVLLAGGVYGGIQYYKSNFFRELPNTLTIEGDLHSVPFRWVSQKFSDDYTEPHSAILLPISVPGIEEQLFMQFDTGAPYSFFRSGCLESLKERGVEFESFEQDEKAYVRKFEVNVSGNRVVMEPARVMRRDISIDWDKPINIIGTIGADFIDNVVCAIDFPAQEIRMFRERPESLESQGKFTPFEFRARRVMLPTTIDGSDMWLFWDSGCSSFGLFTSKYHFDNYAKPGGDGIVFDANRFGDKVPTHHMPCDLVATFGETRVPLKRVSYVRAYTGLQSTFGRFIDGGFFGNKSLTDSTLILDTKRQEFLVVNKSLGQSVP